MLNSLQLKNFKGFQDQRIELRGFSVVIGRKNAGKSSVFEAIRILSNVISLTPSESTVAWDESDVYLHHEQQDVGLYINHECHSELGSQGQKWSEITLDLRE
jgi:AAA15 family ATPase/GTPase